MSSADVAAQDTAAVSTPSPSPSPLPVVPPTRSEQKPGAVKRERKVTPEEAEYRGRLLERITAALGLPRLPDHGKEWAYAGKAYRWAAGDPAEIDDVVDCFTLTLQAPAFDTQPLSLAHLFGGAHYFDGYKRIGRDAYREGIARKRKGANGEYDAPMAANGNTRPRAAPGAPREPPPMPLSRGVPINQKPARLPGDPPDQAS